MHVCVCERMCVFYVHVCAHPGCTQCCFGLVGVHPPFKTTSCFKDWCRSLLQAVSCWEKQYFRSAKKKNKDSLVIVLNFMSNE